MKTLVEFPERGAVAEEAAEWLIRLDADKAPTRDDLQALGEWLRRSPAHREELQNLAGLWGRMNVLTELAVPLGKPVRGEMRGSEVSATGGRSSWRWVGFAAAASMVVAVAAGFWVLGRGPAVDPMLATNGLYATAVGQQKTTVLADGSEVVLNTNSQIRVDYDSEYRDVQLLQGEALFVVAKNADKPFRVYAGNGRIQAVGTAFSVYLTGEDVKVTVTEGRVSVASVNPVQQQAIEPTASGSGARQGTGSVADVQVDPVELLVTLSAGQVATLRNSIADAAESGSILEDIQPIAPQELAQRLAWRDGFLMFSGDTLAEVVAEVGRYTTVAIELPDAQVANMRIGGRLPVGETEVMLAALEASFNLRVTRVGHNRVVVSSGND